MLRYLSDKKIVVIEPSIETQEVLNDNKVEANTEKLAYKNLLNFDDKDVTISSRKLDYEELYDKGSSVEKINNSSAKGNVSEESKVEVKKKPIVRKRHLIVAKVITRNSTLNEVNGLVY